MIELHDLQRLQLAALRQVAAVLRNEAIDETIRYPRAGDGGATDVFHNPNVAVGVGLDPFITAAPDHTQKVLRRRGKIRRGLPDPAARAAVPFRGEKQPFGPGIPSRAVDRGERRDAVALRNSEQRDAM